MKRCMCVAMILVACSGCSTISKYKGVSIEYDATGKAVRRVERESASQTETTNNSLQLKHIQL